MKKVNHEKEIATRTESSITPIELIYWGVWESEPIAGAGKWTMKTDSQGYYTEVWASKSKAVAEAQAAYLRTRYINNFVVKKFGGE